MLGLHDGAQMGKSLVTFVVRLCAILAASAIVPWPASFAASERKSVPASAPRLALVIANADYVKLGQLENPGKDAQLIAEKLRQLSFDVTEKLDRNLKGMADDVDEFARKIRERGKDMVSVLYYAGHGLESDGINYLVPVDADIKRRSDVAASSLSVQRIADRLASAGNQLKNPDSRRLP
jgi:hypothetical protein